MLQEDQTLGQLVSHFYVIADGQVLFNGTSIGNKLIILFESPIKASNVRLSRLLPRLWSR